MKRTYTEFLQDILEAIAEIELFMAGVNFDAFEANREKTLAVVKLLEVIGEAVKKIPNQRRECYPDLPWKSIAGMKDILVHEYTDLLHYRGITSALALRFKQCSWFCCFIARKDLMAANVNLLPDNSPISRQFLANHALMGLLLD